MKIVIVLFTMLTMVLAFSFPSTYIEAAQAQPISVLTNRYNIARTGANLSETILNTSNVNSDQFGKLFSREVEGDVYAQPLYVTNVEIPGQGMHNVVYVATMHNMVYAFDADDPALAEPLWQTSLGTPFTQYIHGEIPGGEGGIVSTPVIDLESGTIYLVSWNWENDEAVHKLHALDIRTGEPKFGSSVEIRLTISGTGAGNVDGQLRMDSYYQMQRPGLLLLNGNIYLGFGTNGELDTWFGWLAAYDASNIQQQTGVFNVAPNGFSGGIWMSGSGIASDGTFLYAAAGNGSFTVNEGGSDYGNSVLKLQHSGGTISVIDWYAPTNTSEMNIVDDDMGSAGTVLIPNTNLIVVGAKDGNLYVIDRNQMGHFDPETDRNLQIFSSGEGRMYSTPVFWENGPGNMPTLYSWTESGTIKAFSLDVATQLFIEQPAAESQIQAVGMPVGSLALSANSADPATGILWVTYAPSADAGIYDGVLAALDATDLTRILWHSEMNPERDAVGLLAKFNSVTVANGRVYVPTFSHQLDVYGLLGNAGS